MRLPRKTHVALFAAMAFLASTAQAFPPWFHYPSPTGPRWVAPSRVYTPWMTRPVPGTIQRVMTPIPNHGVLHGTKWYGHDGRLHGDLQFSTPYGTMHTSFRPALRPMTPRR